MLGMKPLLNDAKSVRLQIPCVEATQGTSKRDHCAYQDSAYKNRRAGIKATEMIQFRKYGFFVCSSQPCPLIARLSLELPCSKLLGADGDIFDLIYTSLGRPNIHPLELEKRAGET